MRFLTCCETLKPNNTAIVATQPTLTVHVLVLFDVMLQESTAVLLCICCMSTQGLLGFRFGAAFAKHVYCLYSLSQIWHTSCRVTKI